MVKRRRVQERDEAEARAKAESHREALLAELKAREAAHRVLVAPPAADQSPAEVDMVVGEDAAP